jgi:hypothetical protein
MTIVDSFNEFRRDEGLPEMPTKWEVCGRCDGEGTLGGYPGVYTPDDFAEDPDFFDDYISHRRPCEDCGGRTTVKVPHTSAATAEINAAWLEYARDVADSYAIEAQERRMGA